MGNVGPIIFANRRARRQLINHGRVITFRSGDRTTGQTWWRKTRTGEKCGDCHVLRVESVSVESETIDELADVAGFSDGDAWRAAIETHHGDPDEGVLYEVVLTDGYGEPVVSGDE